METNKVLHFVPSGKSELLLSCARLSVDWEKLGVPYLVKPESPPVKNMCCLPSLPLWRTTDVVGVRAFSCTYLLCALFLYLFVRETEFDFFLLLLPGRCGCTRKKCRFVFHF